jgi:hypothetical protein
VLIGDRFGADVLVENIKPGLRKVMELPDLELVRADDLRILLSRFKETKFHFLKIETKVNFDK